MLRFIKFFNVAFYRNPKAEGEV